MARTAGLRGVLVALAVLAGLFAMHGLTRHGDHLSAVAAAPAGHAAHDPAAVDGVAADPVAGSGSGGPDGSGALALCLTVLAAACLAMWATARPRGGVLRSLTPADVAAPLPPVRARAPDPPGRWVISVCRC